MSDTPETDRRIIQQSPRMCGCGYESEIVFADFARRLERERDKALALLASEKSIRNHIVQRAAEMERERDLWKVEAERWKIISQTQTTQHDGNTN